jgi:hypothetical protein
MVSQAEGSVQSRAAIMVETEISESNQLVWTWQQSAQHMLSREGFSNSSLILTPRNPNFDAGSSIVCLGAKGR